MSYRHTLVIQDCRTTFHLIHVRRWNSVSDLELRDLIVILHNYLRFRDRMTNSGVVSGFQWIDGSFVRDAFPHRKQKSSV